MGAGLAAIGTLASSSLRAGLYAERHLAEIETARKIIAGMPSREALPLGRLTGALDAHDWRIDSTLIGAPAAVCSTCDAAPASSIVPSCVSLSVAGVPLDRSSNRNP